MRRQVLAFGAALTVLGAPATHAHWTGRAGRRIVREAVRGFVAGYNAYLRRTGRRRPACRGERRLRPIYERTVATGRR